MKHPTSARRQPRVTVVHCPTCSKNIDARGFKRHTEKHAREAMQAATPAPLQFDRRDPRDEYKQGFKEGVVEGIRLAKVA